MFGTMANLFMIVLCLMKCFHMGSSFTKVLVPAIYNEWEVHGQPHWMTNQTIKDTHGYSTFLYQKLNSSAPNYISTNRGCENGAYYRYIVDHYHDFPDVAIFVHAKPHEHQPHFVELLGCIRPEADYININFGQEMCRYTNYKGWAHAQVWVEQCWRDILDTVWELDGNATLLEQRVPSTGPIGVCFVCCQQFLISREMVHKRPLHVWQKLSHMLGNDSACHQGEPDYEHNYAYSSGRTGFQKVGPEPFTVGDESRGRYTQAVASEHLAHVIFGHYGLDMDWPDMTRKCKNFYPNTHPGCPHSPCHG